MEKVKDRIAFAAKTFLKRSETFIYEPLRNISSFEVVVLTDERKNLSQFPHPHVFSISDLPFPERLTEYLTNNFGRFSYFKKIIKDYDIRLIHAHFAWEGMLVLPLRKYFDIPFITSLYGADINMYPRNPVYRWQLNRLFREGDLFLAACEDLKKRAIALGCPQNKIRVQYCGIDLDKFKYVHPETKKGKVIDVLMCGRLVEKKGFPYAIKAFAQSYDKHKNIRLRIIGSGPLKTSLMRLIKNLGLEQIITLEKGKSHAEVAKAMQQAHIFMMAYLTAKNGNSEGTPSVIKEAQAVGLPVVTTKHAGVPEGVLERETGFLAEEKDIVGLSQKLNYLIENPSLRASFGERGRKLVEKKFNILDQARELENIYREMLEARR